MLAAKSEDTEGASSEGEASNEHGNSSKASTSRRRPATVTDWDDEVAKTLSDFEQDKEYTQSSSESEEDDALGSARPSRSVAKGKGKDRGVRVTPSKGMGRSSKRAKVDATSKARASSRLAKGKEMVPAGNSDNAASGSAHPKSKRKTVAGTNNNNDASGSGSAHLGDSNEKDDDEDLSPQGLARTLFKTLKKGRQGCNDL